MKKRSTKKLSLIRETVSRLQGGALAEEDDIFTWNETCWGSTQSFPPVLSSATLQWIARKSNGPADHALRRRVMLSKALKGRVGLGGRWILAPGLCRSGSSKGDLPLDRGSQLGVAGR